MKVLKRILKGILLWVTFIMGGIIISATSIAVLYIIPIEIVLVIACIKIISPEEFLMLSGFNSLSKIMR
jgi:hypothetical protein